jgi:hypothetical protein
MQPKVFSFKSISKLMIMSAFATTLVLGSAKVSSAETHEQSVIGVTDWLFGNLHPNLKRRKLRADEYEYIREWQAIQAVLDQGGLRYQKVHPNINACGIPDWSFPNDDEALKERLANAVFYSRYPGRNGRPISPNDRAAMREWLKLKNSMFVAYC